MKAREWRAKMLKRQCNSQIITDHISPSRKSIALKCEARKKNETTAHIHAHNTFIELTELWQAATTFPDSLKPYRLKYGQNDLKEFTCPNQDEKNMNARARSNTNQLILTI